MDSRRILGLALLVLGLLALAWKGVADARDNLKSEYGPFHWLHREKENVDVPGWFGVVCIVAGAALLAFSKPKEARV